MKKILLFLAIALAGALACSAQNIKTVASPTPNTPTRDGDGRHSIPDPDFYYGLTRLEGIILNIIPTETSVNEYVKQNLEIYPNPATDVVFIQNCDEKDAEYVIYNAMGQEVKRGTTNHQISISDLNKGLYIIKIGGKSGKLVIE